ncbi:MAG: class I SAM-dependent methyltransferase [Chitinophagaceae bacterium]|nr:class I SAM-dependent methyltransferase [Chitinophagaceae bacterium]
MRDEKCTMFHNRLTKVFRHLSRQAKRLEVSCYRVYDHDLPEFPFCIEFYGDKLYVAEYKRYHSMSEEEHDDWMEQSLAVMTEVLQVEKENIFLKLRQRKPGRLGQYQKYDEAPNDPIANGFVVEENGLKFIVNLNDYLDTGLFLDHRITRRMIREQSAGKKVLNLFAYTGSFSVYAAAGGAKQIITVDLSKTYLQWAERNFLLNGFSLASTPSGDGGSFVQADVLQYLKTIPAGYFDLIIMDPPTFSNSKRMDDFLDIQRDHARLINDCLTALAPGGKLYFSTNFQKFILEKEKIVAADIQDITRVTTPFDFEGKLHRQCYVLTK